MLNRSLSTFMNAFTGELVSRGGTGQGLLGVWGGGGGSP